MARAPPGVSNHRRRPGGLLAWTTGAALPCLSSGREFRHLHHSLESIVGLFEKEAEHATVPTCFHDSRFNLVTFLTSPPMSQHRSLKGASTIAARRNVLKRFERVDLLKKRGQWKETSKVIGLPKTKPDI